MDGVDVRQHLSPADGQGEPEDTWELDTWEDLASGHLDSCFQYRLRGLSSSSATAASGVVLCPRAHPVPPVAGAGEDAHPGPGCQLCPLDTRRDCQASLLSVGSSWRSWSRLSCQEITAQTCAPSFASGTLGTLQPGVCFCQKPPDPAWGPEVRSPSTIRAMPALGSHPWVDFKETPVQRELDLAAHILVHSTRCSQHPLCQARVLQELGALPEAPQRTLGHHPV
uniref:Uncharacterized protein n=1 Tax=Molossus molossus TaxID=27622 RepID=A0A7J8BKH6_MOLMO|nr:hypothetical protein HJG59_010193 [Molossus molossus]